VAPFSCQVIDYYFLELRLGVGVWAFVVKVWFERAFLLLVCFLFVVPPALFPDVAFPVDVVVLEVFLFQELVALVLVLFFQEQV